MSSVPEDRLYSAEHAWARHEGVRVVVGISDFAQASLGELVFVRLPAIGTNVSAGVPLGEVESLKSTSDVYAPVSGTVTAVNDELQRRPELVNADPYDTGWLCEVEVGESAVGGLFSAAEYREHLGEQS